MSIAAVRAEIAELDRVRHTTAVAEALQSIQYAMGGNGIFDWSWTPATEARLAKLTARVDAALLRARPSLTHHSNNAVHSTLVADETAP